MNPNAQHHDILISLLERKHRYGIVAQNATFCRKDQVKKATDITEMTHSLEPAVSIQNDLSSNVFCRDFSFNGERHIIAVCCFGYCEEHHCGLPVQSL